MADNPQVPDQFDLEESAAPDVPASGAASVATGEGHPEPTPPSTAPSTPQKPKPSSFLTRRALDAGFSDSEITEHAPDVLEQIVYRLERQAMAERRQQRRDQTLNEASSKREPPPVAEEDPDLGDLSAYDEPLVKALKKAATRKDAELKALKEKMDRLEQAEQGRQAATVLEQADRFFAQNESRYGKGQRDELDPKSGHFARRSKVWDLAREDTGPGSFVTKLQRASKLLFEDEPAAPTASYGAAPATDETPSNLPPRGADGRFLDEIEARKQQWANGGVAKPTARKEQPAQNGKKKAEKTVADWLKSNTAEQAVDVEEEFLE